MRILIRIAMVSAVALTLRGVGAGVAVATPRRVDVGSPAPTRLVPTSKSGAIGMLPDDPLFETQWADFNTGQSVPGQEVPSEELEPSAQGTSGDDDDVSKAWSLTTGSASIVIGETDTGVDYEHPDLAANVWSNPGGIGGCPAGTHGYNIVAATCDPADDDKVYGGHGTHVAGIIGAVGDNGIGVTGMNWSASILPVKWLNSEAWGETSGLIEALQWLLRAKQEGVNIRVVDDSATFVGTVYSQALSDEIDALGANGILFVTSAGNTSEDDDEEAAKRYPCGYDRPTEICVTASDDNDQMPSWANYGAHTVDLAAPGVSVYSTLRHTVEGGYGYLSGGSMAAPQVAGAAALILSVDPSLTPEELKSAIVENVTPVPALSGKVMTGGVLNVCKAMPGCETPVTPPPGATPPPLPGADVAPRQLPSPGVLVADETVPPPAISQPVISPKSFAVPAVRPARGGLRQLGGATIGYSDSAAARTMFTVLLARTGIMGAAGTCMAASERSLRERKHCVRWIAVGSFVHDDRVGRNLLRFTGRLGDRSLAPGKYRFRVKPTLGGVAGISRKASFTILSRIGETRRGRGSRS